MNASDEPGRRRNRVFVHDGFHCSDDNDASRARVVENNVLRIVFRLSFWTALAVDLAEAIAMQERAIHALGKPNAKYAERLEGYQRAESAPR